ncbi:MAG: hypothetical protein ACLUQ2_04590 [Klebsiella pneumoniae]
MRLRTENLTVSYGAQTVLDGLLACLPEKSRPYSALTVAEIDAVELFFSPVNADSGEILR